MSFSKIERVIYSDEFLKEIPCMAIIYCIYHSVPPHFDDSFIKGMKAVASEGKELNTRQHAALVNIYRGYLCGQMFHRSLKFREHEIIAPIFKKHFTKIK